MLSRLLVAFALAGCGDAALSPAPLPAYGTEHTMPVAIIAPGDPAAIVAGWARGPLFGFDRAAVPTTRQDRVREWDFYAIHAPDFAVMVTLAEVRFAGRGSFVIASVSLHDFATKALHGGSLLLPDPGDLLDLAPIAGGNYRVDGSGGFIAYEDGPAARTIRFALDRVQGGGGGRIEGELAIEVPADESIALVTPWSEPGLFFYENKVMAMPVGGFVRTIGVGDSRDRRWDLAGDAFAVMDWVRAVVPGTIDWTWAVGAGFVDGRRIGLNFGSVFGDERAGTPDAVLVDGVVHKLPPVAWDESAADGSWRLASDDGRVDVRLVPNGYRERQDLDLGFYATTLDKPYGVWSGEVELDDGERLVVDGLVGAAERVHTTW